MDPKHYTGAQAFSRMVLEDYLAEQRYQESLDDGRSIQPRPSSPMSTLSKFGHWIRLLPNLYNLSQPRDHLRHLLKHCSPDVQVKSFSVNIEGMDLEPGSVEKAIVDMTLPRVGYLLVDVNQTPPSSSVAKLMDLLDQPSIVLKKLELGVKQSSTRMRYVEGKLMEMVPQTCVSLRELVLHKYNDDADSEAFWSSLFQRCGRVEKLRVDECLGSAQRLAQDMLAYMPNLREISFGRGVRARPMPDGASATLLSGSCNGWKVARLQSNFSGDTIDALSKHSSTLEWLDFGGCSHTWSLEDHSDSTYCSYIDFKAFIDLDPDTGAPKPWQCEASLKELKVTISGIPRPDLDRQEVVEEAYPGEGREVQGQVYDRLARFTNLETLWLGGSPIDVHYKGLEISLESGLGKLSGLKKLREISVVNLATRIGVKEVQWMVANWPRLRTVHGNWEDDEMEAGQWLRDNTDFNIQAPSEFAVR